MKTNLRISRAAAAVSVIALLSTLGVWGATGANLGWTKTSVVMMHHDDVTGIDYPVHRPAFVAGVEVLAVGLAAATAFAGASLAIRRRRPVRA